jgi:hypothetical protein
MHLKVVALEDARFSGFLLALALLLLFLFQLLLLLRMLLPLLPYLLLMLLLHPLFLRLICSAAALARSCSCCCFFVQIGARGMRRCCSGGCRFIVAVNGCSCVGVSLRSGRGGLFEGRDVLAFASALAPPVAANRKGQTMRITHSTLTKLAKIKCSRLIDVGSCPNSDDPGDASSIVFLM